MDITQLYSVSHRTTETLNDETMFASLRDERAQRIVTSFDTYRLLSGVGDSKFGTPPDLTGNNIPSASEHNGQQQQQQASTKLLTRSTGMIAWYCFIASLVVPIFIGLLYKWIVKCQSQRRAQQALDRELRLESDMVRISQMQANVQAFSVGEKHRRTKIMRAAVRRNIVRITEADLHLIYQEELEEGRMTNSSTSSSIEQEKEYGTVKLPALPPSSSIQLPQPSSALTLTSSTCNICLEAFRVHDIVAHASSQLLCRHVFHEDCIVSWFATRTEDTKALCPCCRQVFTVVHGGAPPTTFSPFCAQSSSVSGGGAQGGDNETCSVTDIAPTVVSTELALPRRQDSRRCVLDGDVDTAEPPAKDNTKYLARLLKDDGEDDEECEFDDKTRTAQDQEDMPDHDRVLALSCTLDCDGIDMEDSKRHEDLEAGNPSNGMKPKVSGEANKDDKTEA